MKLKDRWARLTHFLQEHRVACTLIFLALLMLPIFIVGMYDRQSADDYSYGIITRHVFLEYGFNPLRLIAGAFATSVKYWYTWQGHYSAAFMMSLHPAVFSEKLYFLTPITVVGFTTVGIFCFVRRLFRFLSVETKEWPVLAALFTVYLFQCMPSPVQGIYWFDGASYYMIFWGLTLANLGLMLKLWEAATSKERWRTTLLLTFTTFLTSGGNQVSAFLNLLLLALCLLALFLGKRKPQYVLLPLVVGTAGFAFSLLSPATDIRLARLAKDYDVVCPGAINTVLTSIAQAALYLKQWFGPSFFLYLFLITPLAFRLVKTLRFKVNAFAPLCVFVVTMGLVAGMLCPPYYAMADFGSGRLTNIVWGTFVMGFTVSYFLAVGWMLQTGRTVATAAELPAGWEFLLTVLLCCTIAFFGNNASYGTTAYAVQELLNGEAKQYAADLDARMPLLLDPTLKNVEVDPITVGPYLLYFSDITTDKDNWQNSDACLYYDKDSIVLTRPVDLD